MIYYVIYTIILIYEVLLSEVEESLVCPFKGDCSIFCPPELYRERHKTCARYMAASKVGMAAVPHEMSAINYALIQTLRG